MDPLGPQQYYDTLLILENHFSAFIVTQISTKTYLIQIHQYLKSIIPFVYRNIKLSHPSSFKIEPPRNLF